MAMTVKQNLLVCLLLVKLSYRHIVMVKSRVRCGDCAMAHVAAGW
jgi:hypothetical protein